MWLRPTRPARHPRTQQREVDLADLESGWRPVASGDHPDAAVSVAQRRGAPSGSPGWRPGSAGCCRPAPRLHVYLATGDGRGRAVGRLAAGDALRLSGAAQLRLTGVRAAELLVWEMAA